MAQGLDDADGPTFGMTVDTRMTWKFASDESYGFLHAIGYGIAYVNDTLYMCVASSQRSETPKRAQVTS